jgi:hypothetical protein
MKLNLLLMCCIKLDANINAVYTPKSVTFLVCNLDDLCIDIFPGRCLKSDTPTEVLQTTCNRNKIKRSSWGRHITKQL